MLRNCIVHGYTLTWIIFFGWVLLAFLNCSQGEKFNYDMILAYSFDEWKFHTWLRNYRRLGSFWINQVHQGTYTSLLAKKYSGVVQDISSLTLRYVLGDLVWDLSHGVDKKHCMPTALSTKVASDVKDIVTLVNERGRTSIPFAIRGGNIGTYPSIKRTGTYLYTLCNTRREYR